MLEQCSPSVSAGRGSAYGMGSWLHITMSFDGGPGLLGMRMTTKLKSVMIPVADQDRALPNYTEVLGYESGGLVSLDKSEPTEKVA